MKSDTSYSVTQSWLGMIVYHAFGIYGGSAEDTNAQQIFAVQVCDARKQPKESKTGKKAVNYRPLVIRLSLVRKSKACS